MSELLASQTAIATSSGIVVENCATFIVIGTIGSGEDCVIELLTDPVNNIWTDTGEALTSTAVSRNVLGPGTFRVVKPLSAVAYAVNVVRNIPSDLIG